MHRCLWSLLLLAQSALATLPDCRGEFQPHFQKLSLEHGLSQSVVNAIVQDRDGFLWLGTQDGLNRYDGYRFEVFRRQPENPQSLPDNQINALAVDEDGTLWVGTVAGVARRAAGSDQFERIDSSQLIGGYVLSLLADGHGRVWIGSSQGMTVYELASRQFRPVVGGSAKRLPDEHVRALVRDDESLLVGTARGLYRYRPEADQFDEQPLLAERNITSLFLRADGRLVIGSQSGVFEASAAPERRIRAYELPLPTENVQSVMEDGQGRLWIGSAAGLAVDDGRGHRCLLTRQIGRSDTLSSNDVLSLYPDRSGVVWIGTYAGGVNIWNSQSGQFRQFLTLDELPAGARSNTVSSLMRDRDHRLWLGTTDSGLFRLDKDRVASVPLLPPVAKQSAADRQIANLFAIGNIPITQLIEDQRGRIWATSFGAGLFLLDGRQPARRFDSSNDINTLSSSFAMTVFEDHQGEIWLGTEHGFDQLLEAGDGTVSFRRFGAQLPVAFQAVDTEISSIIEDYEGQLWLGGLGGLIRLDRDRETMTLYQHHETDAKTLSGTAVTALRLAPDGDIWVATTDGLNRMHRTLGGEYEIKRFRIADGIPPGSVYGMLPGDDGEIWLSSSTGLTRFQPNGPYGIQYRQSNGLPSDEYNVGAVFMAPDGERLFGSINGAVGFYPDRLPKPSSSSRVVLTGLRKFDQPQSLAFASQLRPSLQLNSDDRIVSFDVAVLDFAEPGRNQFRYRVMGLHEQWIPLIGSRTITLTGLEPGRYQLQVQGAPATGLWSQEELTIDLIVRSPLWTVHTRYGVVIAVLLLLLLGVAGLGWRQYRRRLHALQERAYALSVKADAAERHAQEHEFRTNELQDVADRLEQQRADLQRRLVDLQYQDPLTGLPSRRLAEQFFSRFERQPGLRAMILVDADGMGYLNELHGYAAGDSVLAQLADLLQRVCRHGDAIMRWDSDVFLLVCEVADVGEANRLAERIRASVLQQAFLLGERRHVDLTCSIGFSLWSTPTDAQAPAWRWQSVLGLAREALALAKHFSRNAWFALVPTEAIPAGEISNARRELAPVWVSQGWLDVVSSLPIPARLVAEWPRR